MQYRKTLVGFVIAVLAIPVRGQESKDWVAAAKAVIDEQRIHHGAPGLSAAVGVAGKIPLACGFGLADVENEVPATEHTVYRLASISKPVAAVCAMQLVEAGKLDLDRSMHEFVPGWPEKRWPVTTRQLLAHLGGVRHYLPGEGESTVHYKSQTAALERFASHPLLHEPGSKYHYTTFGYNLVAAAVEQAASKAFPEVVREFIAGPSNAPSLQDDNVRRIIRGRAQGYVRRNDELNNSALMDSSYKLGGGGLCSSAPDLVRFAQALIAGRLVSKATLERMWTKQATNDGKQITYGLGFRIGEHDGRREVLHTGAQSRVSTVLYMLPDEGVVIALMCNLERTRLLTLARQVADIAVR